MASIHLFFHQHDGLHVEALQYDGSNAEACREHGLNPMIADWARYQVEDGRLVFRNDAMGATYPVHVGDWLLQGFDDPTGPPTYFTRTSNERFERDYRAAASA